VRHKAGWSWEGEGLTLLSHWLYLRHTPKGDNMKQETMTVIKRICLRCGHEWWPRTPEEPLICPKCKTPYWNRERKQGAGDDNRS
jgi:predicted Zn-ribbon and HTH transcriptional regulator